MADYENPLAGTSPLARALRMAMSPDDLRNPLMHPQEVNPFALPPKEPRAELRNLPPRPGDYLAPVSETLSPTMGAYGLGNALGDVYVKGKEGDYVGAMPSLAEVLLGMAPVPGMKKGAMPPRVENPIKAYHGSPHDFDKFDLSKIGTGEGAQAYGSGLYFAEREGTAKFYKDSLGFKGATVDGVPVTNKSPDAHYWAKRGLENSSGGNKEEAISFLQTRAPADPADARALKEAMKLIESGRARADLGGKMYEVAIHATPDQFLDWDKPLSQQSEAVRKALESYISMGDTTPQNVIERGRHGSVNDPMYVASTRLQARGGNRADAIATLLEEAGDPAFDKQGVKVWRQAAKILEDKNEITLGPKGISDGLAQQGVAGIRYLDQQSRGPGQGTSNFVVFDPNLIEILRKYGLLGPVALGATANALGQDPKQ